jgi:hypothetical protein
MRMHHLSLLLVLGAAVPALGQPEKGPVPRTIEEPKKVAEPKKGEPKKAAEPEIPDLVAIVAQPASSVRSLARHFEADRGALRRAYSIPTSPNDYDRLRRFYLEWQRGLGALPLGKFDAAGRTDVNELRRRVDRELDELETNFARRKEIQTLLPFAEIVSRLEETRRRTESLDPMVVGGVVTLLGKQVDLAQKIFTEATAKGNEVAGVFVTKARAEQAAAAVTAMQSTFRSWHAFCSGYDPMFSWWVDQPFKETDAALTKYAQLLKDKAATRPEKDPNPTNTVRVIETAPTTTLDLSTLVAPTSEMAAVLQRYVTERGGGRGRGPGGGGGDERGAAERQARLRKTAENWLAALAKVEFDKLSRTAQVDYLLLKNAVSRDLKTASLPLDPTARPKKTDESDIVGRPIGREALLAALAAEMISYSPEQLVEMANREYAWCESEMIRAAREMGFGDDWRVALEKVKTLHVRPGEQPALIRGLALEAIDFVSSKGLVTVPPVCAESWRMDMMSPERQRFSPFFTGGEVITVAFPTNTMSHEAKLQSLRGNNVHFSRATVQHELIPGHHLQQFMNARYQSQRQAFSTPFWTEGWAVYWEMVLYEKGFPKTPEDRVGLMFWRMHRCARVVFSLAFHLGKLTPQQCIDLLVERVGHERENATAEVRRSFQGGYPPLYQAGYLVGAKQFWALRQELVTSGKMTDRAFHDAILKENHMPVELVRAAIKGEKLPRDFKPEWKFLGDLPEAQFPARK